jgi:hypothetical protein
MQDYFATQESNRITAAATMFTSIPTETNTRRPTRTTTPSITPTQPPTKTKTLRPTSTPITTATLGKGSGSPPAPNLKTPSQTGPANIQPNRFTETTGISKFSYIPPAGWKKIPATNKSLTSWQGPMQTGGTACLLVFNIEQSEISTAEEAKKLVESLTTGQGVKITAQGRFINDAGLDAYKMVILISSQDQNIQFVIYLFHSRGFLITAGYIRIAEQNKEQDAVVEQSMKTLKYE